MSVPGAVGQFPAAERPVAIPAAQWRVGEQTPDVVLGHPSVSVRRASDQSGAHGLDPVQHLVVHHGEEEVILACEVGVDRTLRQACGSSHLVPIRARVAYHQGTDRRAVRPGEAVATAGCSGGHRAKRDPPTCDEPVPSLCEVCANRCGGFRGNAVRRHRSLAGRATTVGTEVDQSGRPGGGHDGYRPGVEQVRVLGSDARLDRYRPGAY